MREVRCCLIIPVYRHVQPLVQVLKCLDAYKLPCFIIDDYNEPPLIGTLSAELGQRSWIQVFRLAQHGGKGVASLEGVRQAFSQGFTHAILMDADDQHEAADIPRFIALARQHPTAMILAYPVFDHTAPAKRRFGRIVSNVWVWIETLSLDIKDSLYGYHCLPLAPLVRIDSQVRLGRRLDFDADALVRLFWEGVPVVSIDSVVRYPSDGTSNFHMLRDNAFLVSLHTRLFFGMLKRFPQLLQNHWKKA